MHLKEKMSSDSQKQTALASITATYTDSEDEKSDTEPEKGDSKKDTTSRDTTPSSGEESYGRRGNQRSTLVSYAAEGYDDEMEESDDSNSPEAYSQDDSTDSKRSGSDARPVSPVSFHRGLLQLKPHEIQLPLEPPGRCSKSLQEKISELYSKRVGGKDMNASIQKRKDFRNPSIYEKLITFCNIDERGTNYPPEIYDPHRWGAESFYEELAKRQKEEMEKKEKEKKERTKVEFMSGTAKKPQVDPAAGTGTSTDAGKRKSKWDVGVTQATTATTLKPASLVTPTVLPVATGTKPTVISAFGTITKKPKQ